MKDEQQDHRSQFGHEYLAIQKHRLQFRFEVPVGLIFYSAQLINLHSEYCPSAADQSKRFASFVEHTPRLCLVKLDVLLRCSWRARYSQLTEVS